jgi:hypothetical protein
MLSGPNELLLSDVYHIVLQEPSMKKLERSLKVKYEAVDLVTPFLATREMADGVRKSTKRAT